MNNQIVVGIGNIYASEILFQAKISPLKLGQNISKLEAIKIIEISKIILQKAIDLNGSSIRNYVLTNGEKGNFQNHFYVYGKQNQQCSNCKTIIIKINQANRATFYCPNCQK